MMRVALALLAALVVAAPARPAPPAPLFADDAPLHIAIRGPLSAIARGNRNDSTPRPAELSLPASGERDAIRLSPRGITRLRRETCDFPPLRVEFAAPPAAASPFAGQRRIKLVTHCRSDAGFQQYVLLEYAAYRLYNLLTPASFRARLATIDYVDDNGRPLISRIGFFLEERDDVGRRLGQRPAKVGVAIATARLEPAAAARVALFEYMIGNLDWSMRASPPGDECCHNSRLFGVSAAAPGNGDLLPVPYDFDFSGLVDAPYAVTPDGEGSVRGRVYRGHCLHNGQAAAAAVELRGRRGELVAEIGRIPGLDPRSQRKAVAYLDGFFADIASDASVQSKLLANCIR